MTIIIFRDLNDEWRFRVVARNGRIVAQSEGYQRRAGAMRAIAALKRGMADARIVE